MAFFNNEVEEMCFGLRHEEEVNILSIGLNRKKIVGSIYCTFTLEKEECFDCKSCLKDFKLSTILKHLGQPSNNCKNAYTEEELKAIQIKSDNRRRQKKGQRKRITYDP